MKGETRQRKIRSGGRAAACAALACVLSCGSVMSAWASPQFAYDEETWAKLQDDVMEYEELELLVQEYNPTYLNNQTSYRDGRDTRNAREVRDKQYENAYDTYDSAEGLREQAEYLDDMGALMVPGMASAYASLMAAAAMTEASALQLEQSADASYRDDEMDRLDYMDSQNGVIVQTQQLFASYNQVRETIPVLEKSLELAQESYRATEKQVEVGMATQTELLSAAKSLQSLESTIIQTKASLESMRQQLCIATGWSYDGNPEILSLPEADQSRITSMDPETDAWTAMDQNLSLRSNERAYSNMADGSADKKNMERTIKNQEETIKAGVRNLYNDVIQKQKALVLAQAALDSETALMNAANKKRQLGSITALEHLNEEAEFLGKQVDLATANMNLQQAIETYEWALKGYMS